MPGFVACSLFLICAIAIGHLVEYILTKDDPQPVATKTHNSSSCSSSKTVKPNTPAVTRITPAVPLRVEPAVTRITPKTPAVPLRVEPASPLRVEPASPLRVEPASPLRVEPAVPLRVEPAVPLRVEPAVTRITPALTQNDQFDASWIDHWFEPTPYPGDNILRVHPHDINRTRFTNLEDYYAILGIDYTATTQEIVDAYIYLYTLYAENPEYKASFAHIEISYRILANELKRAYVDRNRNPATGIIQVELDEKDFDVCF